MGSSKFKNNRPETVKGAFRRMLPFMAQFSFSNVELVEDKEGSKIYRAYTERHCFEFQKCGQDYYCWDVTSAEDRKIKQVPSAALIDVLARFNELEDKIK